MQLRNRIKYWSCNRHVHLKFVTECEEMSHSKLQKFDFNMETVVSKINKVNGKPSTSTLDHDEIITTCKVQQNKAISVELIHHMLGGPNMEYRFIEVEESFEAFDFLRGELIKDLTENKLDIMFFEDRTNVNSNIIVVVVKKPRKHGNREHIVIKCLIRMTVMLEPKIGFCCLFDLTGKSCFVNISNIT